MMKRPLSLGSLGLAVALLAAPVVAEEQPATGPDVGARIPAFEAPDQYGEMQTFADLRGPEGLLLLFHRSADW